MDEPKPLPPGLPPLSNAAALYDRVDLCLIWSGGAALLEFAVILLGIVIRSSSLTMLGMAVSAPGTVIALVSLGVMRVIEYFHPLVQPSVRLELQPILSQGRPEDVSSEIRKPRAVPGMDAPLCMKIKPVASLADRRITFLLPGRLSEEPHDPLSPSWTHRQDAANACLASLRK